jgi:hypothetical protein
MSARDGGPAFPRPHSWDESPLTGMHEGDRAEPHGEQSGMSLRDYFAGQAVDRCINVAAQFVMEQPDFAPWQTMLSEIVRRGVTMAYHIADAMLAERTK